jgi:hypothetical protein
MRKKHKLTNPQIAFLIGTRAALAGGLGLLLSGRLPHVVRRVVGIGLVAVGAATTIPAARTLVRH